MEKSIEIAMGTMPAQWGDGLAKSITFCVTEDCNLRCKYCYMTGKNNKKKMSIETAKKAVDYILLNKEIFNEPSVIWEFIGGEPLLEIKLIDKICDYIKLQTYALNHPWFNNYRISFATNGLLYGNKKVQQYIKKNIGHLSIGISIDGNKTKHDLQRIKKDGTGSYDEIRKNIPLWMEQFPDAGTKSTFTHDDIPYLKDSIISLWHLGIKDVSANVVFEDVWKDGDDIILEAQLKALADYVLENEKWKDYSVSFFEPYIGYPLTEEDKKKNWCGAGRMLAIDCEGRLFPCIRFYDISLNNKNGLSIGDIENGIDTDKIRPFLGLDLISQSPKECIECDVAKGCSWCQGNNYDLADSDTIYQRSTYICKMHKATVSANKYFWEKFEKVTGLISERKKHIKENRTNQIYLQFITADNITPHCNYRNYLMTDNIMTDEILNNGIAFCRENNIHPVILGTPTKINIRNHKDYIYITSQKDKIRLDNNIFVHDNEISGKNEIKNTILLIKDSNIDKLSEFSIELYKSAYRINIVLENIEKWSNFNKEQYQEQLGKLANYLHLMYKKENYIELNVLTDLWDYDRHNSCGAGIDTFTLGPNGKIYICPAFYFDDPKNNIGSIEDGIDIKNQQLLKIENAPICKNCDVFSCKKCKYLNKKLTNEYNTPSKIQCEISHIERKESMKLQKLIMESKNIKFKNIIKEINYSDPLEKIINEFD